MEVTPVFWSVPALKESPVPNEVAPTTPLPLVESKALARPEILRLVEEAVVNCAMVPETAVVLAYGMERDELRGA
jgi:hypothetical protein